MDDLLAEDGHGFECLCSHLVYDHNGATMDFAYCGLMIRVETNCMSTLIIPSYQVRVRELYYHYKLWLYRSSIAKKNGEKLVLPSYAIL